MQNESPTLDWWAKLATSVPLWEISQDDANYGSFLFNTSWIKLALVGLLSGFGGQNGFHMLMGL